MLLALSLAGARVLAQTDGTLDVAFDLDGAARIPFDLGATLRDVPVAVAVHGDGRIVVLGTAATDSYGDQVTLARLEASGQVDVGFGGIGFASFGAPVDDFPTKLVAEPDGAVVVAGSRLSGVNPGPELFLDRVSAFGFYAGGTALSVPSLDSPWVGSRAGAGYRKPPHGLLLHLRPRALDRCHALVREPGAGPGIRGAGAPAFQPPGR